MTAIRTATAPPGAAPLTRTASTEVVVARRAFKQVWVAAAVWALAFGATIASSAITYANSYPDHATRVRLAATTGRDRGLAMLLGPVSAIDTVGGYTVYKAFVFLTAIGAIWGLLIATRLLRGEEDAGRWHLVLAGTTRAGRATVATLAALFAAVAVLGAGTTAISLLAARDPDLGFSLGSTLLYGCSLTVAPAVFVAIGALTSQLGRTRRVATTLGMGAFGVLFVVRMVADAGPSTHWILWLTPFGWVERMRPFTENDVRPLLLAVVAVAALSAGAVSLSTRRDAGSGVISGRDVARPRPFGLASPTGLALRLDLPVLSAWFIGSVLTGFAFGLIGKVANGAVSSSVSDTLDKFGIGGTSFVLQFFGVAFLLVATVVALIPVAELGAAAEDETSGRLFSVLARPVRRVTVLAGRVAIAAVTIAATAAVTGLAAWLGAASQGVEPGLGRMIGAGLNVVPTALLVLGLGVLVLAIAPRTAVRAVYAVVITSIILDILTALLSGVSWLDNLSLFHYMALAPAAHVDATAVLVTLVLAVACCGAGLALFRHRDLHRD
jgi:polyether ionophore transport system permease protein